MNSTLTSRSGWLRWWTIAVCIPTGGLLIIAVLFGVQELRASAQLRAKMDQLKQLQQPYDNASFRQWYRDHTHRDGTQAWVRALDSVSATSQLHAVDNLPFVGSGKELPELDPQLDWLDEPRVEEYLKEMQGLIQQVHSLKQWSTPVQLPIEFDGAPTLLPNFQQARDISHLLQLDFEYAVYHKELDRAFRDLESIGMVAKAIDVELCLVVDLIAAAIMNVQYGELQRSMLTDNWPTEKLDDMRQMVGAIRFSPAKWKKLFTCERAMFADDVASGDISRVSKPLKDESVLARLVPLSNQGRLRIFEAYDELIQIGSLDFAAFKSASRNTTDRVLKRAATFDLNGSSSWINLLFPASEGWVRALENEESNRRMTLTAIALRQFKRQEGRWPNQLSELEKVGLAAADYHTVNRGQFGYEIVDAVAYIWSCDLTSDLPVKATRPSRLDLQWYEGTVMKLR